MCTERGGKQSFLCPPRTRFNQKTLVCDFRRKVKCTDSSDFFHKNVVLEEKPKKKVVKNTRGNKGKLFNSRGRNIQKRPRLNRHFEKLGLVEKKPQYIKTHGNGQMNFAPLFKERNRHNLARILDVSSTFKHAQTKKQDSFSINDLKNQEAALDISKNQKKQNSPIIHVTPAKSPKLQLLIAQDAGESLAKLRQDPEQPSQELLPPPPPSVNPFQIVGHVMSSKELISFPDSPMVNISVTSDAHLGGGDPLPSVVGNGRASDEEPHLVGKNALGLPLQLKKVSQNRSPPLIWVSPASLARSPMVSLRRLWDRDFPIRRTLTMSFPDTKRREVLGLASSNNSL
uniref:Cuticular protein analogous to peritrophins 1J [Tribolium castaneum] n=1 Tax=Lepeophtheirus salmonis TaxID=72036 RepID=A0A0K2V507_LEPSM